MTMNALFSSQPVSEDQLYTKQMAAQKLSVSIRTLDRLVKAGRLEKVFIGSSPRFRKSDLDQIVVHGI